MSTLKKLSAAQLNKIIDETQAELRHRKNIDAATLEIRSIIKKYKIDIRDIDLNIVAKSSEKSSLKSRGKVTTSHDRCSSVRAKFKDPNSAATWTGRGRTPAWVQGFCQNECIDIDMFKKDDRYRC
jgi:DNA-binding protein H-NS